ncbi:retrovirus-related pol polyprotein from transposon TNT 1-94 [Tanacetum coccineum]
MEILVKTCLMPLALKTQNDSFTFVHELKQEMHADLKYVEFASYGLIWYNAGCKHKWEEIYSEALNAFFKEEGIEHQTSTPRTPEQNGVVKKDETTLLLRLLE